MRAGFACMNDLIVTSASQGLVQYVSSKVSNAPHKGIVIGYDGRYFSKEFAYITAIVFASKGYKIYLYSTLVPTPFVVSIFYRVLSVL